MSTEKNHISSNELVVLMKANEVTLIDVRSLAEFGEGHIGNALHRPIETLPNAIGDIPKETLIVTICNKGHGRSEAGMNLLRKSGWENAFWLEGGYLGWVDYKKELEKK